MKIAIIGYGLEGQAAYDYWSKDNEITICDQNEVSAPEGVATQFGESYLNNLNDFDVIVRSPFVHPSKLVEAAGPGVLDLVTSNTNEFLKVCPTKNIIGVTGTKGKGTTATLIANMLGQAGKIVHLGGNIGVPALELLKNDIQEDDWVILELSSFQLIDLKSSPHIAVCLMVVPEHLDWHEDFEEYIAAKQQLFMHQDDEDLAIYYAKNENSVSIADASMGVQIPFYEKPGAVVENGAITIDDQVICQTDELKLLGEHNWQNACAAVTAAWQVTQDVAALRSVLTTFAGLEHRLELVRELGGVSYYNDSFSSGLHSTEAAIASISLPKVVVVGGYDRMLPLDHFMEFLKTNANSIKTLMIIGASGIRLIEALNTQGYSNFVDATDLKTMPEVVAKAKSLAADGDAILLSPGFASFDMFKNFEDRGVQFKAAVLAL
ncbi:MAG: UDP-N-acetylmuramoylalanine--D-glutamate ligase [Candidatus Saccharibacteria bacterium]|nr:UDP-N-acetylmuramoylalanine--D-glutamate ligase [Candidatus Saccharibacteria bacterium]